MIRDYERKGSIHGFSISRITPSISHLFFANDSFIFFKATMEEANSLHTLLRDYEKASGQCINLSKSTMAFSRNTSIYVRDQLSNILGIQHSSSNGNYLGLPMLIGRNRTSILKFIKHRIVNRLIKSIESTMNSYWWKGGGSNSKGIIWKKWSFLCKRKKWGGLGFRDLHGFNLALLSKQAWILANDPNSLASRVLRARYYPNSSFLDAKLGANPSFIWSSLMATQDIIRKHSRWRIGNGSLTRIWGDNWCNTPIS
ncbi:PREDICTED: uncharacterized protein LOC109159934 [Ipomoea nil]|uniref:uncharacterized protein LOC109159934 n=1 Tax=Ipomoea nil TaxID=35883 RepID=UPI000900F0A0|nr:PREDICTED: uncharacterized protein LOC109159934 [Ipomoea nil]